MVVVREGKLLKLLIFIFVLSLTVNGFSCGWSVDDDDSVPDYDLVFPEDKVNRIDIKIEPEDWQAMLYDMTSNYGEFGRCSGVEDFWDDCWPTIVWPDNEPVYVQCRVTFGEYTWEHVGIRFKGASTLTAAWLLGYYKIPFKLDFDQFEDQYPETKNQRFFGFKRVSFANNIFDPSYLRGKVCMDLFREGGVTAPYSAFYRVFIDKGDGPVYFGLYTATEVPARAMFITQFGDSGGNLYKPGSEGAQAWKLESPVDSYSFPKRSNEEEADFSDIQEAIDALHEDRSDVDAWRTNLDGKFDTQGFMKWLAINTVLELFDISGNHYLYADPSEDGQLHWIPWDVDGCMPDWDITLQTDPYLGFGLKLDMSNVSEAIPLITYLLDDAYSYSIYHDTVEGFSNAGFSVPSMNERLVREHDLIEPYVVGSEGELPGFTYTNTTDFEDELQNLYDYVTERHSDIDSFL